MQAGGHRFESGILHVSGERGASDNLHRRPEGRKFYDIMEKTKQEYKSENTNE